MEAHERRMAIWRSLCCHRVETATQLAAKYQVSARTIYYDLQILSLSYPIVAIRGRYNSGFKIPDWYKPDLNVYSPAQLALLLRLKENLSGNDLAVMTSIIDQFSVRRS